MALQRAERFRTELLRRGVLLVPVIWGERRETKIEKKGFGLQPKAAEALPSIGVRIDITMCFHESCFTSKFLVCLMTLTHKIC